MEKAKTSVYPVPLFTSYIEDMTKRS